MATVDYKTVHCWVCWRSSTVPVSSLGWADRWVCDRCITSRNTTEVDRLAAVRVEVREREAMLGLDPL